MLKHLYIKNFTLIDELDIDLHSGFSVITGETGAGKSIILGAIGLLLGQRADSKSIKQGADKCVIEAHFDLSRYNMKDFFSSRNPRNNRLKRKHFPIRAEYCICADRMCRSPVRIDRARVLVEIAVIEDITNVLYQVMIRFRHGSHAPFSVINNVPAGRFRLHALYPAAPEASIPEASA